MSLDALLKLAKDRAAAEEAKPLEQRRREYRYSTERNGKPVKKASCVRNFTGPTRPTRNTCEFMRANGDRATKLHWSLKSTRPMQRWRV
jgi:hypothetical protein